MTGLLTLIGASIAVIVLAVGVGSIFAYFNIQQPNQIK